MAPELFGCFKREDKQWAECLPYSHMGMDAATGSCVGTSGWLCPNQWLVPSPPALPPPAPPPPAPPVAPSVVRLSLARTKGTVSTLRTWLILGGIAFGIAVGSLSYVLCFRRAVAPHLTSVVDEDAAEVGMSMSEMSEMGPRAVNGKAADGGVRE